MSLRVGESGKLIRVASGFDMSSYTELALTFTDPDGITTQKTTVDGVTLGIVPVTDPVLGTLLANEYVDYDLEPGLVTKQGLETDGTPWYVALTYTNDVPIPPDVFIGGCSPFTVNPGNCGK